MQRPDKLLVQQFWQRFNLLGQANLYRIQENDFLTRKENLPFKSD